jgi:DNA-binding transcriptional MerR regulator
MKVVVQETGLTPDTLRAWERRYGMPRPERTEGGHRLYSQYEIDMLKWLIVRQEEGLSISNAVDLWRRLEAEGQDPLLMSPELTAAQVEPAPISGETLIKLRSAWIEACLNFDEQAAGRLLAQAFAMFPLETVCFELLQQGLHQIGQGWYEGSVSVQQEHFASSLALRQLDALFGSIATVRGKERLLIACPPKEQHTFSLLLLALLFRRRNWNVVYLGANVPAERLGAAVQAINPEMVIVAAQTLYTAGTLREVAALLRQENVPLGFGGAVFNALKEARSCIPGYFLGEDLQKTPDVVEQLLQSRPPLPQPQPISPPYREALAHFRERRSIIESHIYQTAHIENVTAADLSSANEDFGNNLTGALALGNIELFRANIYGVQGLLMNHHYRMPAEAARRYLEIYHEAVQLHLDERGQLIRDWFEQNKAIL